MNNIVYSNFLSLSKPAAIINGNATNNKLKYSVALRSHTDKLMVLEYQYKLPFFSVFCFPICFYRYSEVKSSVKNLGRM